MSQKTATECFSDPIKPEPEIDNDLIEYKKLPKSFFPDCWSEETRINVLFAPFRARELNPINYDNKLQFWIKLINKYCEFKGSAVISLAELKQAFKRNNIKPYALDKVFEEMVKAGQIQQMIQFMSPPQSTWSGWLKKSMTSVVSNSFIFVKNRLWSTVDKLDTNSQLQIFLNSAKKHAEIIQTTCPIGKVLTFDDITEKLTKQQQTLSIEGTEVALQYLLCKNQATIRLYVNHNGKSITLIKLADGKTINRPIITDEERAIYNLNQSIEEQILVVEQLEKDASIVLDKVRECLNENKKTIAKIHLKQKHIIEVKLKKNVEILNNFQKILSNIHDSKHNANIIDIYKMASDALHKSYQTHGITVDKVDDVMADVKETLDEHEEITSSVGVESENAIAGNAISDLEEEQLEKEWQDLIKEAELQENSSLDKSIENRLNQLNISNKLHDLSKKEQEPAREAAYLGL